MDPEPSGTSSTPAYSAPRGLMCTGLTQTARPRFLCFLLPGVHAADVGAAQMPSSSNSPAPGPAPPPTFLPSNIGKPEFPNTGWERIKERFQFDKETQKIPVELDGILQLGFLGAITGFVVGGMPAAHFCRQRYIEVSQAELYTGRVDAVRSAHNAALRGFIRYGYRWSWRVALILTLFGSVNTGLSVYRDKDAVSNYVASGAVSMGLFRFNLGLRGVVAGSIIGALMGAPFGALIIGLQKLTGETFRERRRREHQELYEHKLEEWSTRMRLTDELISSLNSSSKPAEAVRDLEKVEELLSLPRNTGAEQDSSS